MTKWNGSNKEKQKFRHKIKKWWLDNWNSKHLMGLRINLKTKAFSFAVMYSSFTALLLFSVNQKFSLPFFLAHPSDIVK